MKKMFYVLLALLVSMVLVFGVSCDNSNKAPVKLSIHDGDFSVNVYGSDMVDSSTINDIKSQTNDEEKKIYTLEAVVNVGEVSTDEKKYSSFVMQLTDSGIDVTITSEAGGMLSAVAGKTINFTRTSNVAE